VPGILNLSFADVEGETLLLALKDLAISTGSACTSASLEPSHVLRALGIGDELAYSALRFSIGRFTTAKEIDHAAATIRAAYARLRAPGTLPSGR
jgi:cysteine desulfurase